MLIYEEGAFFKKHQDSEKVPGMFGTLAIALPSAHTGGDLILTHRNDTHTFKSEMDCEFNTSFAAWYADVWHEVKPVTSGVRFVLTYNLVELGSKSPQVPRDVKFTNLKTRQLLESYEVGLSFAENDLPLCLVHKLDHSYTQASLSLQALKGDDFHQAAHLKPICDQLGFDMFLACIEQEVRMDDDYEDEIFDRNWKFKLICKLDGTKHAALPNLKSNCVLLEDFDEERECDLSEHEGYTGNEGAPAFYWYYDTALVIVPPSRKLDFSIDKVGGSSSLLDLLREMTAQPNPDLVTSKNIARLCELIIDEALQPFSYGFSKGTVDEQTITEALTKAVEFGFVEVWEKFRVGLITKQKSFSPCLEALVKLLPRLSLDHPFLIGGTLEFDFKRWFNSTFQDVLVYSDCEEFSQNDVRNLATLATNVDEQLQNVIVSKIISSSVGIIRTFVSRFTLVMGDSVLHASNWALKVAVERIWQTIELRHDQRLSSDYFPSLHGWHPEDLKPTICASGLRKLLDLTPPITGYTPMHCVKLLGQAFSKSTAEYYGSEAMPFLTMLLEGDVKSLRNAGPDLSSEISYLVKGICGQYEGKTIGVAPVVPENWAMEKRGCGCKDCLLVDYWMIDPISVHWTSSVVNPEPNT